MGVLSDIRISIRTLAKNRAFTIAAVLTVAIGIGATTAIVTIVDSILSDRAWRAQYPGNSQVLGSSMTIDGRLYTVVGIMSPGFAFPDAQTDFWIPLTSAPVPPPSAPRSDSPNSAYADGVFARLRDGVSIEATRTDGVGVNIGARARTSL